MQNSIRRQSLKKPTRDSELEDELERLKEGIPVIEDDDDLDETRSVPNKKPPKRKSSIVAVFDDIEDFAGDVLSESANFVGGIVSSGSRRMVRINSVVA